MSEHKTRESWLLAAIEQMKPLFKQSGYTVPAIRVTCGWPSRSPLSAKKRRIGECWSGEAATDGQSQIFISPFLDDIAGSQGVLATLLHEVVHAVVGVKEQHNKVFSKCARAVKLDGPLTATYASEALVSDLEKWSEELGYYPHAKLDLNKSPVKKQSTRMIKCECGVCGYVCRVANKWLDEVGEPHCPEHGPMKAADDKKGEGDE